MLQDLSHSDLGIAFASHCCCHYRYRSFTCRRRLRRKRPSCPRSGRRLFFVIQIWTRRGRCQRGHTTPLAAANSTVCLVSSSCRRRQRRLRVIRSYCYCCRLGFAWSYYDAIARVSDSHLWFLAFIFCHQRLPWRWFRFSLWTDQNFALAESAPSASAHCFAELRQH